MYFAKDVKQLYGKILLERGANGQEGGGGKNITISITINITCNVIVYITSAKY